MEVHLITLLLTAVWLITGTRASSRQMLDYVACIWKSLPDTVKDFSLSEDVYAKQLKTLLSGASDVEMS